MYVTQYVVKDEKGLEEVYNLAKDALKRKLQVNVQIEMTKDLENEYIVEKLSDILIGMEEYHSKKCSEFEKKHIINYINKVNGSYVKSEHMRMLFKKFNLKY